MSPRQRSGLKREPPVVKSKHIVLGGMLLAVAGAASALAFNSPRPGAAQQTAPGRPGTQAAAAENPDLIRRASLRPLLREALGALGDRLERPGREQLMLSGTMARGGGGGPSHVQLVRQFPSLLRAVEQSGGGTSVVTFNGSAAAKAGGELTPSDEALVETLVYDSAEGFFAAQARGANARHLGSRFRLDDGAGTADPSAPAYDVYLIENEISLGGGPTRRAKLYYLNSDTLLLERVRYEVARGGDVVRVEVRLGDWQKSQGQNVPMRVERFEDGSPVFALTFTNVAFGPRVAPQAFAAP
jgi:hypothetical protein